MVKHIWYHISILLGIVINLAVGKCQLTSLPAPNVSFNY